MGDVKKIRYENGVLHSEKGEFEVPHFDIVMFGSPCQSFSAAMQKDKRIGLEDAQRSGLFYECYRVLKEVNPTWFLLENVASMKNEDRDTLSGFMGVKPIKLNAADIGPCSRPRYYWTNIEGIKPLPKVDYALSTILENGYSERAKARGLLVSDSRPLSTPIKMFNRYYSTGFTTLIFKSEQHYKDCVAAYKQMAGEKGKLKAAEIDQLPSIPDAFAGVRYLTQSELEKCQDVPAGYTKCLTRNEVADVLGDGWHIGVITHILKNLTPHLS